MESSGDLVRSIETSNEWVVLWNVESDPRYKALLDEILDPIAALLGDREGGMCRREAFVFISSAESVTPVHFDPEHNFLLQIHGVKQMHVGRFATVEHGQRELERYYIRRPPEHRAHARRGRCVSAWSPEGESTFRLMHRTGSPTKVSLAFRYR